LIIRLFFTHVPGLRLGLVGWRHGMRHCLLPLIVWAYDKEIHPETTLHGARFPGTPSIFAGVIRIPSV
jgi:hypothetical protein